MKEVFRDLYRRPAAVSEDTGEETVGPFERWRRQQVQRLGQKMYNGTQEDLRKFFRPKRWEHGHVTKLEGRLFTVVIGKDVPENNLWIVGMGAQIHENELPLRYFSKKRNQLGSLNKRGIPNGTTVMATGDAVVRTPQSWEGKPGTEPRFVEVLTTEGVGYLPMKHLRLAKKVAEKESVD